MPGAEKKRQREKQVVGEMIRIYCRSHHDSRQGLCPQCQELYQYACRRSDLCPFMETKTFCSNCKVHCYHPVMRRKIKEVMAFSGPRLIFSHPVMTLRHLWESRKEQRAKEDKGSCL